MIWQIPDVFRHRFSEPIPLASTGTGTLRAGFRMARYFLHVKRGRMIVLDQEGVERGNVVDAKQEVARRAHELMEAIIKQRSRDLEWALRTTRALSLLGPFQ